jgi:hypothetical protein
MMSPLLPSCKPAEEQVPYLAVPADDSWHPLVKGHSAVSGRYIIEEAEAEANEGEDPEDISRNTVMRRLVFLHNQHFVQTEARLRISSGLTEGADKVALEAYATSKNWDMMNAHGHTFDHT